MNQCKKEILRKAGPEDLDLLLKWANEEQVRRASFQEKPITLEQHKRWFQNVMNNSDIYQYIYEVGGKQLGQIRITIEAGVATISYSIAKEYRGQGYGRRMVTLLEREVKDNLGHIWELHAYVKNNNVASKRVFEGLGYEKKDDMYYKNVGERTGII